MLHNRRPFRAAHLLECFCIAASCLSPSVSRAQTNAEETVKSAMTKDEHGMYSAYDSVFAKWLPRFGDASAVALTKFLADRTEESKNLAPLFHFDLHGRRV